MNSRPTILIVDDVVANINLLASLLKDEYKIKIAKNGKKALEIANQEDNLHLILLDIEMPEMNGYEVCKQLKNSASTSDIPVVFLTARDNESDEEYGLNLGAVDYIAKPYNPAIVKIRVRNHVALKLKSDWLEELSMMDGLTHIPNRRYFDDEYKKQFKQASREQQNFFVVMIDVDEFKSYNDHYGHGKGDECLLKIAETLQNQLKRPMDMLARYGGEEFVIIMKDIEASGALTMVQRLVDSVESLGIKNVFTSHSDKVTISAGIAKLTQGDTQTTLLKRADKALYKAKKNHKNGYIYL